MVVSTGPPICLCKVNGLATEAGGGETDSVVTPAANPAAEFCNPGDGDKGREVRGGGDTGGEDRGDGDTDSGGRGDGDDVTGVVDEDDFDAGVELEPVFIFSIIRYYFLL